MITAEGDTAVQKDTATATMTPILPDAENATALPFPDFTCRHPWGDRVGRWLLT